MAHHLRRSNYRLSFNLFTELKVDGGGGEKCPCSESPRENTAKYNIWTFEVVKAIRATRGNNTERIFIVGSPGKTAKDLPKIDKGIYESDQYMLAEWHVYASGPNKKVGGQKYRSGDGIPDGRTNVKKSIKYATEFTTNSNLLTYLGAWRPADNKGGSWNQTEVINFARFFAGQLKKKQIPWSLIVLDRYYDTSRNKWLTEKQDVKGRMLNMSRVLDNILEVT